MLKNLFLFLCTSFALFADQGQIVEANGIQIWHQTFGKKEHPPLLLIMGACCQGVIWPKALCDKLAQEGFYVIRYDHRDAGLSSCFDWEKTPYDLLDIAKDAIGLLDSLHIQKAHLFGISMGGLTAEIMAAYYPDRVHSLMVMGSSCDIRPLNLACAGLPPEENAHFSSPAQHYLDWMQEIIKLAPQTEEDKLAQRIEGWNQMNGHAVPLDEKMNRDIHTEFLKRLRYPQGIVNHILTMRAASSEELVRTTPEKIHVPTIILQGSEDPLFPPDHGKGLHHLIAGSEYHLVKGMGHVPNDRFFDLYIDLLKQQALRSVVDNLSEF